MDEPGSQATPEAQTGVPIVCARERERETQAQLPLSQPQPLPHCVSHKPHRNATHRDALSAFPRMQRAAWQPKKLKKNHNKKM